MGLILDSSVIIAEERKGQSVSELLTVTCEVTGFVNIMLSAVSVTELEHGYWRAGTPERARRRRAWLDEVLEAIPVGGNRGQTETTLIGVSFPDSRKAGIERMSTACLELLRSGMLLVARPSGVLRDVRPSGDSSGGEAASQGC